MKKILFIATDDSHILHFHIPHLNWFKEQGYEVHVVANGNKEIPYCDQKYIVSFNRNPIHIDNLKAMNDLKKIINNEHFDFIHCHNPIPSAITRLVARKTRKNGTKVVYTAHGFHFYKGAPLLNWIIYYQIEKWLAKYTDCLITINQEDYNLAKEKFKAKQIEIINGVGVDKEKFQCHLTENEKNELRESLGIKENDLVITCVAELNKNKNQLMLIEAAKRLIDNGVSLKILFVGMDSWNGHYQKICKNLNMEKHISFLGYRNDVAKILKISNLYVATSQREGLGINIIEAIFSGLPVIATNNRGHREIIVNGVNGLLVKNSYELEEKIEILSEDKKMQNKFIKNSKLTSSKFLLENVMKQLEKIFNKLKEDNYEE